MVIEVNPFLAGWPLARRATRRTRERVNLENLLEEGSPCGAQEKRPSTAFTAMEGRSRTSAPRTARGADSG